MDLQKYLEIPFKWGGRSWDGADCYGLVILYFRVEFGIEVFDLALSPREWELIDREEVKRKVERPEWTRVKAEEIRRHDVVVLRNGSTNLNHCGIIMDPFRFLHMLEKPRCNVSRLSLWRPHIFAFYRHRDLQDPPEGWELME